ncbi:ATP-dependent DNA helicase [Shewanella marina]|uniref:ATP-dependent DNA helicase n=1 Tax=Shewanella marina TaxID=487319 RepID=UPI000471FDE3|nr:ATP-dependent DNA helicase [Shewanella marina]
MHSRLAKEVIAAFAIDGTFARHIKGYQPRQAQIEMATAISDTMSHSDKLIVEAGTGVGKTFAYLLPAMQSGKQVIISTGSKNLQEQLFYKDIPALMKMFDLKLQVALLKGRNNYLCQHQLDKQLLEASKVDADILDDLLKVNQWAGVTKDGDLSGITSVTEDAPVLSLVVSTKDNCLGKRCDSYDSCFVRKARQRAMQARIIVVNHHLFFADRILKDGGFAELLPDADVVIFDEAHQLADIAISYFGDFSSTKQLNQLYQSVINIYQTELRDTGQLKQFAARCQIKLSNLEQLLRSSELTDWRSLMGNKQIAAEAWGLVSETKALMTLIQGHLGRSELLDDSVEKLDTAISKLENFFHCEDRQAAYSIEFGQQHIQLRMSPINVAQQCQQLFEATTSWIFTSATLQMDKSLQLFASEMGLSDCPQLILDSPFDYAKQALLCVPRELPSLYNEQATVNKLVQICIKAATAAEGRTFILFTSHRMLKLVASQMHGRLHLPLLVQGQASKQTLLNKYRQLGNAVLLGTGSFWEGIDVRGKLLSCVIIDKLPFASPDDPLIKARSEAAERQGKDPFMTVSLPQAIITLKQGMGRLIRDEKDRGVLILCDNRIVNRQYGQVFLNSIPDMQRTRDLDKAVEWLKRL